MFDKLVVSFLVDEVVGGFFISVPPGHVACIYDRGRGVLAKIWGPGLHLKLPFWQVAKLFNAQTLEYAITKDFDVEEAKEALGDEPIIATTQDGRTIQIEGTILLRLNKEGASEIWESIGENIVSKVVRPVSRSRIRSVVSNFAAEEVISSRRDEVEERIRAELIKVLDDRGIIIEKMLLSDVRTINRI